MAGKRAHTPSTEQQRPPIPATPLPTRRMFAREVPAFDLSKISLFVINDNEFVRTYMLRLFGIMRIGKVTMCADPFKAHQQIGEVDPDIVVLDLDLTGIDGLDLVRAIRRGETEARKDVPILVAAAFVDRDYVEKARNSGTNWTLVKPLTFKRLYEGLVRVILDERPFVESEVYAGPDRRLLVGIGGYDGFDRRKERKP